MNRRAVVPGLFATTITLISCSGGAAATQPDPTPTVATVSVSAPSTTLIPQQTAQLAVVMKSGDGVTLTGHAVTYSSSAQQVASVSASGLVSALAVGTTTITASSEGKSGTLDFTVAAGTVVGSSGGTVTGGDGAVTLTIPAGALAGNTPISIVAIGIPASAPSGVTFNGTAYQIGTSALTFSQPVTIKLKYDPATLPLWVMSGDMVILGGGNTGWTSLSGIVVDTAAKTVSGTTTSIGGANGGARGLLGNASSALFAAAPPTVTIAINPATVTLTPESDSVNPQKRSVKFHASIVPTGNPVRVSVPGATAPRASWRYRWRTTGLNGTLAGGTMDTGWLDSPDVQYICTNANLAVATGKMDDVILDVLLNPGTENDPVNQRIVRVVGSVFAGLSKTFEITPDSKTIGPGVSQQLQFIVRNAAGSILPADANTRYTWDNPADAGNLQNGSRPDLVTYLAKSTFTSPPPHLDRVEAQIDGVATVSERSVVWDFTNPFLPQLVVQRTQTVTYTLRGGAHTFVTVHVDYTVTLQPGNSTVGAGETQALALTLTPAFDGPGLAYVWSSTGAHGTLSETNGNHSANRQATYTARAGDPGGTDQISVKVVSYAGGTELETLGTGTASVAVTPKIYPGAWRMTSFTQISSTPRSGSFPSYSTSAWNSIEQSLAQAVQTPTDAMIFLEDNILFGEHAVYFQVAPPGQGLTATYSVPGSFVTELARPESVQFSHYTSTGDLRSGTIDGEGYFSNVFGATYVIEDNTIQAQKNGTTMTGTLTLSPYLYGGSHTYRFVATLVTPGG